jgi:hypothetical protein
VAYAVSLDLTLNEGGKIIEYMRHKLYDSRERVAQKKIERGWK